MSTSSKKLTRRSVPDTDRLPDDLHPVLKRVYASRNVCQAEDLDYSLVGLLSFEALSGIHQAVQLLQEAIELNKRILIVADFDTDGATSCALAIRGLSLLGAREVIYVVPNRFEYGYGLTPEIVDVALEYDPDLLITVDNGISSIEGVKHAKQHGLKVLITDHHLPGEVLPDADAIVNPQLSDDQFQSKNLAGVGVVFYVLLALRAKMREQDWFEKHQLKEPNLAKLLDLVALGTVADVVPLDKNNRIMVAYGLKLIRHQKCVTGITALLNQANRSFTTLSASDLGFAVAPRLNAAGRLTDMSLGIECLLEDDDAIASKMAQQLDQLNLERRRIQDGMHEQATIELDTFLKNNSGEIPLGISLYNEDWHQGVIGILAARIKELFNRPVIAFARENESMLKGSARSVTGLHIRDCLEEINRRYPDLIETFGGHAMAAGLTIKTSNFKDFSSGFVSVLMDIAKDANIQDVCMTDGELSAKDINLHLAQAIQEAGPWGQAFPEPLFEGQFELLDKRIVGEQHLKLKLRSEDQKSLDAIAFNITDQDWPKNTEEIRSTYRLAINDFRGNRSVQLVMDYIEPL